MASRNYTFRNSSEALPAMFSDLLQMGEEVGSRNGRTMEFTHIGITLTNPLERELLVPSRKPNIAAQIAETMWILAGRTDVEWLARYLPRAMDYSDDGQTWRAGYGGRLRAWKVQGDDGPFFDDSRPFYVDQLEYVVDTLRAQATSRQAVISLWDPQVDTKPGKDIACNNWLCFTNRLGSLDLHVAIRSNDAMWGWSGINVFEWSVLQELVATLVGAEVGALHFSVGSWHLYEPHWERAKKIACEEPLSISEPSPRMWLPLGMTIREVDEIIAEWFEAEQEIRQGRSYDIDSFPEPMMRSWLRVIKWWWTNDGSALAPLAGTRLFTAATLSVQPQARVEKIPLDNNPSDMSLVEYIHNLHVEKDRAYGDSWKRRGEMLGILANIARKIDRLTEGAETSDETQLDTAVDLVVYLAKYRWWLTEEGTAPPPRITPGRQVTSNLSHTAKVRALLEFLEPATAVYPIGSLNRDFDQLEDRVTRRDDTVYFLVDEMLQTAWQVVNGLWRH